MSDLIAEGLILVKSWSGHLDAPTSELRMIESLIQELEQKECILELINPAYTVFGETGKPYYKWLKQCEEFYFKKLMQIAKNNQSEVTRMAGLNRGTIRKKLKQYNLI